MAQTIWGVLSLFIIYGFLLAPNIIWHCVTSAGSFIGDEPAPPGLFVAANPKYMMTKLQQCRISQQPTEMQSAE
jgi:hypothetical protein